MMFYYGFIPQWVFSGTAFIFGVLQLWPHIRREELSWYQIEHNYGEIFFAFSASVIPLVLPIEYATALLLAMAISDGVTGIVPPLTLTSSSVFSRSRSTAPPSGLPRSASTLT